MLELYTGVTTWWVDLKGRISEDRGATAVEYGLICALIVLAILGGIKTLGEDIAGLPLQSIIDAIQAAIA